MDVSDDRLGARLDRDVLHTNSLLPLAAHSSERLDLRCEGSLQLHREIAVEL
ncbi:hypothetical protein [Sphingomonas sp. Leaf33]|uniref:hypothetical protein n=1 Tax=Sphingomonas sp. Leaf33 TaxID=1736215 RepID=UPI0039E02116